MLGLPGEQEIAGVMPARRIVDWYNGSLDMNLAKEELDLTKT